MGTLKSVPILTEFITYPRNQVTRLPERKAIKKPQKVPLGTSQVYRLKKSFTAMTTRKHAFVIMLITN